MPIRVHRAALAALLVPAAAAAQDARVTVLARAAGEPVADASVRAGVQGARTDARGAATLRLAPGVHTLLVRRLGFEPWSEALRLRPGQDTTVTAALLPAAEAVEEIIVASTRAGQRIEDEPVRVEVLTREEVEEKMLMTPGDISMLLNETSGLRVQPTSPALGGAAVRVQGLRGRYTQLLADGLPLYGGQSGALGLLQIPPMDLGQVEVIKGTASALYGPAALGGVVNLIARRPGEAPERELLLNATTRGGMDLVGYAAAPLGGGWGYSMLAGGHLQRRQDVDGDRWADMPGYERAVLRPRLFLDDDRGRTLLVTAGYTGEEREGGGAVPGGVYREALRTRRADLGAVARLLLGDRLLALRASAMVQGHRHHLGDEAETDRHATGFAEAAWSGSSGRHGWVVGGSLQADGYRARQGSRHDFTHHTASLFVQDEVTAAEWLALSLALRADANDDFGTVVSPRLSLLARPGPWTMRASAGSGAFVPTPFTEETEPIGLARLRARSPALRPERAATASLDVGWRAGDVELNATAFGSRTEHALQLVPSGDSLALVNARGAVRTWGTELLGRWHAAPLHLTASYTWLRAREPDPLGGERREVPLTPRHAAGMVAMWEDEAAGRVGVELYYTGVQRLDDDPRRDRSRPFLLAGMLVERRVRGARVFVNFENLTDVRQTRDASLVLPTRRWDGRWTTDVWAPLEGRVVNAGIRLER